MEFLFVGYIMMLSVARLYSVGWRNDKWMVNLKGSSSSLTEILLCHLLGGAEENHKYSHLWQPVLVPNFNLVLPKYESRALPQCHLAQCHIVNKAIHTSWRKVGNVMNCFPVYLIVWLHTECLLITCHILQNGLTTSKYVKKFIWICSLSTFETSTAAP